MFNTRRLSFVAVLLVLAAGAALGLAACGGGGGEDAQKVLDQTFSGSKKVRSGKLDLKVGLDAQGSTSLGGPVSLALTGPFQSQGPKTLPKFDFDLTLSLGAGRTIKAGAVSTGTDGWLKFQDQAYTVPSNVFAQFKSGFESSQAKRTGSSPTFSSLGVDPSKWLKDPKNEGETDVAGVKTIHISAGVDVPKLLDDVNQILSKAGSLGVAQNRQLPTQLTPQQRKSVQDAIDEAHFDVYTGKDDKTLRRLAVTLKFKVPKSKQQTAQGLTSGTLTFDLTLADLNQAQTINAPPAPQSFTQLTDAVRNVLGGALGAGAASGGASGGTSGSGAGALPGTGTGTGTGTSGDTKAQQYAQCISQAAGDITKAQKCQSILTGG